MPLSLTILLVTLGQLPLSTSVELPSGQTVNLAADYANTVGGSKLSARGNVELSSQNIVVRADELTYDSDTQVVTAKGNVRFFSYPYVGVADEVTVDIDGKEARLSGGLFMKKRGVTAEQLLAAKSVEELKTMGDSQLSVTGTSIRQLANDTFEVENLSFTPCDCDANQITWRVEARKANVQVGERATLTFPVVYVKSVPVFALPWLYLPVTDRRSGLLVTRPTYTPNNGVSIDQPVFVTLGDSYDTTLTPGYYFGNLGSAFGVKGPRLQTEFRYVPSAQTSGRATLGLLYDLRDRRDPTNPGALEGGAPRTRGLRLEGSLAHDQDLGDGWRDRVDASFVSDAYYPKDLTADILARENQYLRSTGVIFRRSTDAWVGLDVALRQDLRWGYSLWDTDRNAAGTPVRGPNTLQRLPALSLVIPERKIAGPLNAGISASLVRIAPVFGGTGDEGRDGRFLSPSSQGPIAGYDCDGSQGNRRYDGPGALLCDGISNPVIAPGEREARMRLDVNPRISADLNLARFATVTPYAFFREDVYYGEATGTFGQRGYPAAGAAATTELSRIYGWKTFQFRHAITPVAEVRYVPFFVGMTPGRPYDEVDAALPGPILQGVAEIRQQLMRKNGAEYHESLRFDLGQGFDFMNNRAADTYARLGFDSAPAHLSAVARYDLKSRRMTQVSASASVDDGRGDAVYSSYDLLLLDGPDRVRRGIDALVGAPVAVTALDPNPSNVYAEQITAGIRFGLKSGFGARYEAIINPRQPSNESPIRQQIVGVSYGPACDCWRLEGQAVLRPNTPIQFGLNFSISRFGSFGTGG